jgi:hypothetical protein
VLAAVAARAQKQFGPKPRVQRTEAAVSFKNAREIEMISVDKIHKRTVVAVGIPKPLASTEQEKFVRLKHTAQRDVARHHQIGHHTLIIGNDLLDFGFARPTFEERIGHGWLPPHGFFSTNTTGRVLYESNLIKFIFKTF